MKKLNTSIFILILSTFFISCEVHTDFPSYGGVYQIVENDDLKDYESLIDEGFVNNFPKRIDIFQAPLKLAMFQIHLVTKDIPMSR